MSRFELVLKLAAERRREIHRAYRYETPLLERDDDVQYLDEDSEESE